VSCSHAAARAAAPYGAAWLALAWQGVQSQPDGPDLDLRRCDECGSTLACELGARSGRFAPAIADVLDALQRAADATASPADLAILGDAQITLQGLR
jgi:hypothetical protein